jgi:hypothetical protein
MRIACDMLDFDPWSHDRRERTVPEPRSQASLGAPHPPLLPLSHFFAFNIKQVRGDKRVSLLTSTCQSVEIILPDQAGIRSGHEAQPEAEQKAESGEAPSLPFCTLDV